MGQSTGALTHAESEQVLSRAVLHELEAATTADVRRAVAEAATPWEGAMAGLDAFLRACCDTVYGTVVMREGRVAPPYAEWCAAEEPRIVHSIVGAAAMLIAGAAPADRQKAFEDARTVVLRLAEGIRRR